MFAELCKKTNKIFGFVDLQVIILNEYFSLIGCQFWHFGSSNLPELVCKIVKQQLQTKKKFGHCRGLLNEEPSHRETKCCGVQIGF